MKYIDAEKLIAEIKRLHKAHSGKHGCDEVGLNLEYLEEFIDSFQQEPLANMVQWTGNNLKEVIDFTGKSPRFGEWFKSWEEYENYVHSHNDILKLFCEDGSHYEVPVGAWIVKTPDGYNLPSVAKYVQQKRSEVERGWGSGPDYNTEEGRYSSLFKHRQEQPDGLHFTPLNRLIQKIPSENWNDTVNNYAKKLCDCLTKEGYLKDAAVLQGYISYMNGNNVPVATMDEQEKPEAKKLNINEYIKSYFNGWKHNCFGAIFNKEDYPIQLRHVKGIARHFYELGLNSKK